MAKVNLTIIKSWFQTGFKPTQTQFSDTYDSFWHKDEQIPIAKIEGINDIYNSINNITNSAMFVPFRLFRIFKHPTNTAAANKYILEINDVAEGFLSNGTFIPFGKYLGGDIQDIASWDTSPMWQIAE